MSELQLLFLGTGTSTGIPLTPCLTLSHQFPVLEHTVPLPSPSSLPPNYQPIKGGYNPLGPWPKNVQCPCCRSCVDDDVPDGWKNRRGNTSVVLRKKDNQDKWRNVIVDVGKTFREQARRFFPRWGVKTIDAVLLTHGHADAYFGLDDLREWCIRQGGEIPVYLNRPTYEIVANSFPYMVDASQASGGGDIPRLTFHIIENEASFTVFDIDVQVLPVEHGVYFNQPAVIPPPENTQSTQVVPPPRQNAREPLICLGFMFDHAIAYISDASGIPESTWKLLLNRQGGSSDANSADQSHFETLVDRLRVNSPSTPTKVVQPTADNTPAQVPTPPQPAPTDHFTGPHLPVLIIDTLWPTRPHASHFSFAQALSATLRLNPSITYLLGFTHPTTHRMWEEICRSLVGQDGQAPAHPDDEQSRELVKTTWDVGGISGKAGLGERARNTGLRVEPSWDGLVISVGGEGLGAAGWKEIKGEGGSAGGWGF